MVSMTALLYLLSFPYLYFGTEIFLMITAGAIFNIGFNSLFLLYAGSFNRKRIDLTKGGFGNTQGSSDPTSWQGRPFGRTSVDYGRKAGESGIVGHQTLANEYRVFPVKESGLHGASTIPVAMSKT